MIFSIDYKYLFYPQGIPFFAVVRGEKSLFSPESHRGGGNLCEGDQQIF